MLDLRGDKNPDRIEELKKRLYSKDEKMLRKKKPGILHAITFGISNAWKNDVPLPKDTPSYMSYMPKTTVFKKFFIIAMAFFVIAAGFAVYTFLGGSNTVSTQNIDIKILGNSFTSGGDELPLQIEVTNENNIPLEYSDLLIEYPKSGSATDSGTGDTVRIRKSLGTIKAGQTVTDNIKVVLYGEQGSTRTITTTLEYRLSGANAIFVKEKTFVVNINSAPLNLAVDAPESTNSNQPITIKVRALLNAQKSASNILLVAEYPPGFVFESAEPKSIINNNVWEIGSLAPGVEKEISIKGSIIADDGEEKSFHFYAGEGNVNSTPAISVVYNSILQTIAITKPFLEAKLEINGTTQNEYAVSSQSPIRGKIRWSNNLPTQIMDAEIHAKFSGTAFDKSTVQTSTGFYNSVDSEIVWDKNTIPAFASIQPGDSGSVDFSVLSLPLLNSAHTLLTQPSVIVDISIKGKQPGVDNTIQEVNNFIRRVVKINSDFQLVGRASYSTGPFTNTGTIPPKAEQETTYTITWTVTNSSNRIISAEAKATLPVAVKFKNKLSPINENLVYNPTTGLLVWKIGTVEAGTGFTAASREVSFQVGLTPSTSQIQSTPLLLNETTFTGTDTFTSVVLGGTKRAINTLLSNDPAFVPGGEVVTP